MCSVTYCHQHQWPPKAITYGKAYINWNFLIKLINSQTITSFSVNRFICWKSNLIVKFVKHKHNQNNYLKLYVSTSVRGLRQTKASDRGRNVKF